MNAKDARLMLERIRQEAPDKVLAASNSIALEALERVDLLEQRFEKLVKWCNEHAAPVVNLIEAAQAQRAAAAQASADQVAGAPPSSTEKPTGGAQAQVEAEMNAATGNGAASGAPQPKSRPAPPQQRRPAPQQQQQPQQQAQRPTAAPTAPTGQRKGGDGRILDPQEEAFENEMDAAIAAGKAAGIAHDV
jgi:hypothetical protein